MDGKNASRGNFLVLFLAKMLLRLNNNASPLAARGGGRPDRPGRYVAWGGKMESRGIIFNTILAEMFISSIKS